MSLKSETEVNYNYHEHRFVKRSPIAAIRENT